MNANLKRKVQVGLIFGFLLSFSNIGKCESDPFIFNGTYLNLRGPGISTASLDSSPNNIDAILNTSFKSITGDVPNLGTSNKSNFVRFRLTNNSDKSKIVIHQQLPYASHVSLFQLVGNKLQLINAYNISEKREGRAKDPFYFFTVNLPPHETGAFILMIKSGERLLVPLSVSTPGYFGSNLYKTRFILYGIFISVMLVMLLYNLFIYFSIKNRLYLYYVLYILFVALTQTSMLGIYQQFFPFLGRAFNPYAVSVFTSLVGLFAPFFAYHFLKIDKFLPKIKVIFNIVYIGYILSLSASLLSLFNVSYTLLLFNGMLAAVLLLSSALIILIKKKERIALIFTVAWLVFLIGVIIHVLKDLGFLPVNTFTTYTMPFGAALETILLSFALADRINTLKQDREESQRIMLEEVRKRNELTINLNRELEAKVHERTQSLELTNKDLNNTLDHLKDTQGQLVEAEKMASLGQLTAGIAHEINNPINFVSSNVAPLRKDLSDVSEILNIYRKRAEESDDPDLKKILEKEKELDLDYSLNEMKELIAGIEEGARRTSEIVTGLKNFSRTDEGEAKEADINQGIRSTLTILKSELGSVSLESNLGEIPEVRCYLGKLNQVFMNILDNSIDAVKDRWGNQPEGLVKIDSALVDDQIVIRINDNGAGIPAENLRNIFDPFFTTKEVGKGTGLGLAISYGIIEKHNGTITVDSELNKGTTFEIKLPINTKLKNGV